MKETRGGRVITTINRLDAKEVNTIMNLLANHVMKLCLCYTLNFLKENACDITIENVII
jgi:hypothetical protein